MKSTHLNSEELKALEERAKIVAQEVLNGEYDNEPEAEEVLEEHLRKLESNKK